MCKKPTYEELEQRIKKLKEGSLCENRIKEELKENREKYRSILKNIEEGYFETDIKGNITFFNNSLCNVLRYPPEKIMGLNNRNYYDPEAAKEMYKIFNRVFKTGKTLRIANHEIVKKDGNKMILDFVVCMIKDHEGKPAGFCGIVKDIIARKKYEEELAYLAYHDPLTDLFNRKALFEHMEESLIYAKRYNGKRVVLYLDLDRFKQVNDTLGHEIGDKLLKMVSNRLRDRLRKTDYISRIGGDEFIILLTNPTDIYPDMVAKKIIEDLSRPYIIEKFRINFITPSIGISVFPKNGEDVKTLINCADKAMYKAKEKRSYYVHYFDGM